MKCVIAVENGVARHPLYRFNEPLNIQIEAGEQLAVVGRNGAGKSLLIDTLTGRYPLLMNEVKYDFSPSASTLVSDNLKYITFRDSYGDADGSYYYQQRWNSQDIDPIPLVRTLLPACSDEKLQRVLYDLFDIDSMLDKRVVCLSSGELRRFQLTKTLLSNPKVLVLDNPFIGLDAHTRESLRLLLEKLIGALGLQVILVMSKADDIPDFITHVVQVEHRTCGPKRTLREYLAHCKPLPQRVLPEEKRLRIIGLPEKEGYGQSPTVVCMDKVSICYGERVILKDLDWTVRRGDRWALTGENGSGKSTLLSLLCADNPQSYACRISLFGRKRGSGESIWKIKKQIGYVSPEMHRAYLKNMPAIDIVASGLHDSIGLYKKTHDSDKAVCEWWMDIFGIVELKDRSFLQLSSGEQRMVLLARAFVKDPELLVLDEPLHGLDGYNSRLVKDIIEAFCARKGKTLIMVTHYPEELPDGITHSLVLKKNGDR